MPESLDAATIVGALLELTDVAIAAQSLNAKWGESGRPYLALRARELQSQVYELLDELEASAIGWEPTNHANR